MLYSSLGFNWTKTAEALSDMAEYFTTREQQQLFSNFYKQSHTLFGSSVGTLNQALAKVESNVQWAEQRLGKLVNFLAQRNGAGGLAMASSLALVMSTILTLMFR
ncbi:hypothetical protein AWZ03_009953 [Drosophila navojoa]|uniref:Uncharacterized protein n=1 Tax=Drosophila navojoa TaxID=7232 RepID=A0A484B5M8_DRONA|nr:hypothetical protein AWZ03_009953 [Drosophila navojoa]